MQTGHAQKKRRFAHGDKSDSVMNDKRLKSKFLRSVLGNLLQLMLGHVPMCFIVDSFDLASIFKSPHDSPKIDRCSSIAMMILRWRLKRRLSQ